VQGHFNKGSFLKDYCFETKSINCDVTLGGNWCFFYRSRNTLRFPRAAGEPPRACALRGLTYAFAPAGVSVYFLRLGDVLFKGKQQQSTL